MTELTSAVFSEHALSQMRRRGISEAHVYSVLGQPEEVLPVREGRVIVQGFVASSDPARHYLLRVIVDVDQEQPVVVTAYKTSKLEKYRSRA